MLLSKCVLFVAGSLLGNVPSVPWLVPTRTARTRRLSASKEEEDLIVKENNWFYILLASPGPQCDPQEMAGGPVYWGHGEQVSLQVEGGFGGRVMMEEPLLTVFLTANADRRP